MSAIWEWIVNLFDVRRGDGSVSNGRLGGLGVFLAGIVEVFAIVAPLFEVDPEIVKTAKDVAIAIGVPAAGVAVRGVRDALTDD